jgi:hypothetical protein
MASTQVTSRTLEVTAKMKMISFVLMGLGALGFAFALFQNQERAWYGYLTSYFYFVSLGLGGLFFLSVLTVANSGWSANIKRFPESLTSFLPWALGLGIVFLVGAPHVYEWLNQAVVAKDEILTHKAAYLNFKFFAIRIVLFVGVWVFFAKKLVGYSLEQDKTGDDSLTPRAIPYAIGFLLFFALSYSLFSVDLVMSLQPHWFSTIFGVYAFAGLFQSSLALMVLMIIYCMNTGVLKGYVDENHLHDVGKFLFAFTVFWAYIAYSQYMLIWYANLPEETSFFIPRQQGAWGWVSLALIFFRFIIPFMALLPRWVKRSPKHLAPIAVLILIMQYVDLYWLIYPNLDKHTTVFGVQEILIFAGFAGMFMFAVMRFLGSNPIVPLHDPREEESLHHHVVY